jgi:hypothetical protein
MPLVGGGGAPNVSGGSNPAGTGTSLNYIGNHVYATSGAFTIGDGDVVTALDFTTDSQSYIVADIQAGFVNRSNDDNGISVKINGETISSMQFSNTFGEYPGLGAMIIMLPPSSRIQVIGTKINGTTNDSCTVWLSGRVYA